MFAYNDHLFFDEESFKNYLFNEEFDNDDLMPKAEELDPQYVSDTIDILFTEDYVDLFRCGLEFPWPNRLNSDDDLIRTFHKSIMFGKCGVNISPYEAWWDKKLVKQSALNRIVYRGNCRPDTVLRGFYIARITSKVSVFRASVARNIISKYLSDVSTIFDPFSGFSGRMLGTVAFGKKYIGRDIDPIHIQESISLAAFKGVLGLVDLGVADITTYSGSFESLFTCSPYRMKETWNPNIQIMDRSCDEWIDECLKRFHCKRYVFVVDDTERYKDYVAEIISNRNHLSKSHSEKIVVIDNPNWIDMNNFVGYTPFDLKPGQMYAGLN